MWKKMDDVRFPSWSSAFHLIIFLVTQVGEAVPEVRVRKAQFTSEPTTVIYETGDTAILHCSVHNLGDRTVIWRRVPGKSPLTVGGSTWVKDSRILVEHMPNSEQWNLVVLDVLRTDAGVYECQVSLKDEKLRQHITLEVKDESLKPSPPILISGIQIGGENVIKKGDKLKLFCNASLLDEDLDGLVWVKDGRPLFADSRGRIKIYSSVVFSRKIPGSTSSVLEIERTRESDSGTYVCKSAENTQMAGVKVEIVNGSQNIKRVPNRGHSMNIQSHSAREQSAGSANRLGLYFLITPILTLYSSYMCIVT